MMSNAREFSGITVEMVNRIKEIAHAEHGVMFEPAEGTNGTARWRHMLFGECVVRFVHDNVRSVLVLTLLSRPWFLPEASLWKKLQEEIGRCPRMV